jgi:hypothetical protein
MYITPGSGSIKLNFYLRSGWRKPLRAESVQEQRQMQCQTDQLSADPGVCVRGGQLRRLLRIRWVIHYINASFYVYLSLNWLICHVIWQFTIRAVANSVSTAAAASPWTARTRPSATVRLASMARRANLVRFILFYGIYQLWLTKSLVLI